ncbi:MAG: acyl carrier protein [Methylocystaceae bacterium]|nr:acyl carrier protein [Methylocystaceae bacterium]
MNTIEQFIFDYISDHTPDLNEPLSRSTNFVECGLLDSFEILNFIMTIESEFNIKFQPQELANPDIRVISTLADVISHKMD